MMDAEALVRKLAGQLAPTDVVEVEISNARYSRHQFKLEMTCRNRAAFDSNANRSGKTRSVFLCHARTAETAQRKAEQLLGVLRNEMVQPDSKGRE